MLILVATVFVIINRQSKIAKRAGWSRRPDLNW
jgi:hypothetical protein